MNGERSRAPVKGATQEPSVPKREGAAGRGAKGTATAEVRLARRVYARCHEFIAAACAASPVREEFLGAQVANESGGDPCAARFEPAVYQHLKAVAAGESPRYGGITAAALGMEVADVLHPKADAYHARFLASPFGANHEFELASLVDEPLRELATSWGYTQIMGYHVVGTGRTVRRLLDPAFHFRFGLELLAQFVEEYQLDPAREFAEMFRCWNTGRPYGATYDPEYAEHGLERMEAYRQEMEARSQKAGGLA